MYISTCTRIMPVVIEVTASILDYMNIFHFHSFEAGIADPIASFKWIKNVTDSCNTYFCRAQYDLGYLIK